MTHVNRSDDGSGISVQAWRRIKRSALGLCLLAVAGIVGLMVLAAGKDEDIAGIVAMGLLAVLVTGGIAIVAAVWQKRAQKNASTH